MLYTLENNLFGDKYAKVGHGKTTIGFISPPVMCFQIISTEKRSKYPELYDLSGCITCMSVSMATENDMQYTFCT